MRFPFLFDSPRDVFADVLPVAYPEDIYDLSFDFEDDSVIPYPELPESSQVLP